VCVCPSDCQPSFQQSSRASSLVFWLPTCENDHYATLSHSCRAAWRDAALASQGTLPDPLFVSHSAVSLPKLKDFDWRIDFKTASNQSIKMAVPTCIIDMKVEEQPLSVDAMSPSRSVTFEVTRVCHCLCVSHTLTSLQDTLETVLDGLGKIRDQLASVAGSQ
jgi:hypothetical protein